MVAHVAHLRSARPAGPARVTGGLDPTAQLVEVDHDGDAVRRAAGGRLGGRGYAEPRRRQEGGDGEADGVPQHRQAQQPCRYCRPGAACAVARRHWSRFGPVMPWLFAYFSAAWS